MHQLTIDFLGPIRHCQVTLSNLTILTGGQASGKSLVSRAVYFFKSLKKDFFLLAKRERELSSKDFVSLFTHGIRDKFFRFFGSPTSLNPNMSLTYEYRKETVISIVRVADSIDITLSKGILDFLQGIRKNDSQQLKQAIDVLFDDEKNTIILPAGRDLISGFGNLFDYLFATMEDEEKKLWDPALLDFQKNLLRIRPQFESAVEIDCENFPDKVLLAKIRKKMKDIMKGEYKFQNGQERILVEKSRKSISLSHASSGQKESVWVLNLLFYHLLIGKKVFCIIEEPETGLFPETQKRISEFLALMTNQGNDFLLTTNSPYIIGSFNNLFFAKETGEKAPKEAGEIIDPDLWLDSSKSASYFLENGILKNILDKVENTIDMESLDKVAHEINKEYDDLLSLLPEKEN